MKLIRSMVDKAKNNAAKLVGSSVFVVGSLAKTALCVGVADAAVTGAFTGMGDDIVATMGTVAPFAIGVMAFFLGF